MKTKTIIRLAILMTMATLLGACCIGADDTYHNLSKDAINVWEISDTLIYTSNWGGIDTFVIDIKSIREECEDNEEWCDTKTCHEYLRMRLNQPGFEDIRDSAIVIYTPWSSDIKRGGEVTLKGRTYCAESVYFIDFDIEINEVIYKNVFKLLGYTYLPKIVNYIYYNKTHGILQYQLVSGEIWTLQTIKD